MSWKRFIVFSISICVLIFGGHILRACWDYYEPYDYSTSFFLNNINNEPAYNGFNFYDNLPYLQNWYVYNDCSAEEDFSDPNIDEWYAFANGKAGKTDITNFVYKYAADDLAKYYLRIKNEPSNPVAEKIGKNKFAQWLAEKRNADVLSYLLYSKKCEPFFVEQYLATSPWGVMPRDTSKLGPLIKEGLARRAKTKSQFLKWRYTYQLLRLTLYNGREQQTIQLYDDLIGNQQYKGIMYGRCLGLKAGALFRSVDSSKMAEAAYLYSRVFDRSDEMKQTSFISYDWCGKKYMNEALRYCKNNHEKAVIYTMQGLYERDGEEKNGLIQMRKAYALDPNARELDVIMTREINKLEARYYPRQLLKKEGLKPETFCIYEGKKEFAGRYRENGNYGRYIGQLKEFGQKVIDEDKNNHKAYWHLSLGYLNLMSLNAAVCEEQLAAARKYKMSNTENDVYNILEALCVAARDEAITDKTEAELLPTLKYIAHKAQTSSRFNQVHHDIMIIILAAAYLHQKDTVRAIYCLSKSQQNFCEHKTHEDNRPNVDPSFNDAPGKLLENMSVDGLKSFIQKKNKTPFEQWLLDSSYYSMDALNELDGTKYIRLHEFGKARAVLAGVSKQFLNKRAFPDPFTERLNDFQIEPAHKGYMNKYTFAKTMVMLENKMAADPKDAEAMYKYATGLYSISYYGKAWDASEYSRESGDNLAYYAVPARKKLVFDRDYYDVSEPEKYFARAYKATRNKELRAKCLFMAAKCWQKRCAYLITKKDTWPYDWKYYKYAIQNPYFYPLGRKYNHTKFFDEAYSTCSYLRDYVKKEK